MAYPRKYGMLKWKS